MGRLMCWIIFQEEEKHRTRIRTISHSHLKILCKKSTVKDQNSNNYLLPHNIPPTFGRISISFHWINRYRHTLTAGSVTTPSIHNSWRLRIYNPHYWRSGCGKSMLLSKGKKKHRTNSSSIISSSPSSMSSSTTSIQLCHRRPKHGNNSLDTLETL